MSPSLHTTAFIAGSNSTLKTIAREMPLNIYSIFVGPPTTGKSQVIKLSEEAAETVNTLKLRIYYRGQ